MPYDDNQVSKALGLQAMDCSQKKAFQPYHSKSVPKSENLGARVDDMEKHATTVMLRNIPNKYTQATLLEEIDKMDFAGTYDFFYLPMDVHNRSNVGYAFINFLLPEHASRFSKVFGEHRFKKFQSRKISSVCTAHVQGLDANLRHFENRAVTHARNDQYRPVVLKGNVRVDFELAVAEAKARSKSAPDQSTERKQRGRSGEGSRLPCKVRGGAAVEMPLASARHDLEAALCEYLLSRQNSEASTAAGDSSETRRPRASSDVTDSQTGLYHCDRHMGARTMSDLSDYQGGGWLVPPPGLSASAQAWEPPPHLATTAAESDDISSLLALRGLLVDRLQEGMNVGGCAPASIACSPSTRVVDTPAYIPLPSIPSSSLIFQGRVNDEGSSIDQCVDGMTGIESDPAFPQSDISSLGYAWGTPGFEI